MFRNLAVRVILTLFILSNSANALAPPDSCSSKTEKAILGGLEKNGSLPVDLVTALLVAEGIEDSSAISAFQSQLNIFIAVLDQKIKTKDSDHKKSRTIFEHLHHSLFKKYITNALLHKTFLTYEFNCVTATTIFYLACQRYQIPVTLLQTPTHVYSTVNVVGKRMIIELTDPKAGFDFKTGKEELIEYLLEYKLITVDELAEKGVDGIYNEQIENAKEISPAALIGITYSNRAAASIDEKDYTKALCCLEKASHLDPENEAYCASYLFVLDLARPPQVDFAAYTPFLERAALLFRDNHKYQQALLPYVVGALNHFDSHKDYETGARFLERIRNAASDSATIAAITEYDRTIQVRWAASIFLRGEYEAAHAKLAELHRRFPNDKQIDDLHVTSACQYANRLIKQGQAQTALPLLDSLQAVYPKYPVLKEAYVEALLSTIDLNEIVKGDFGKAQAILLRAYSATPADQHVSQMLGRLHHDMAMAKIREGKFAEATNLIKAGLKYDPNNMLLQNDLKEINESLNKKKR